MWNKKSMLALLGVSVAMVFGSATADELTAAKKADLRAFVEYSGAKNLPNSLANGQVQQMVQAVRRLDPKFPDRGFEVIRSTIAEVLTENADKPNGLYEKLAEVYHNNFTHDEIKELMKFYNSPIGKKLNETQGKMQRENMQATMQWAGSHNPEIDRRVKEALAKEKIKLPEPPQQAAPKAAPAKPAAPTAPAKPAAPAPAPATPK